MEDRFTRLDMLIGDDGLNKLINSHVVILGVGGVGSFSAEAIARSAVGTITLCDHDTVSISNINRQLVALSSTVGKKKVEIARDRIKDINPNCNVLAYDTFVDASTIETIIPKGTTFVIDAIDTVKSKIEVIEYCKKNDIKIISAMGAGNKLDPTRFKVADISKTSVCPLAKVIRHELKKRNIKKVPVVFSDELPIKSPQDNVDAVHSRRHIPGSTAFTPSTAGLILASYVVNTICSESVN